ncbi:MAG TPA: glycosyltransferase family 4 protein [Clostridia bacterium]
MKIAFLDTSNYVDYPIGGQLTSVRRMLEAFLQYEDVELLLIGIRKENDENLDYVLIKDKKIPFISVYVDSNNPDNPQKSLRMNFMKGLLGKSGTIRRQKADVFFLQSPESFLPVRLMFPFTKIATFSHGSFYNIFNHIRFQNMRKGMVRLLLKRYLDTVVRKSNVIFVLDKQSVNEYTPYNRNVIKVTNSIDISKFRIPEKTGYLKRAVFVGRLSANKRVDIIIRAVAEVDGISLDIYGTGEEYSRLEETISELNVSSRVLLKGAVDNEKIVEVLPDYDVLIMNSIVEGMPMVILEAMAAGLAVISTRVGAVDEIIIEGENGIFTDGSYKNIAEAIRKLGTGDIAGIRERNRACAAKFDYHTNIQQIYSALKQIIYNTDSGL